MKNRRKQTDPCTINTKHKYEVLLCVFAVGFKGDSHRYKKNRRKHTDPLQIQNTNRKGLNFKTDFERKKDDKISKVHLPRTF